MGRSLSSWQLARGFTSMISIRSRKARLEIDEAIIIELGERLAAYRLDGCKDGIAQGIIADVKKVASKHRRSYSEVWAKVHKVAYEIISVDPRASI